LRHLEAVLMPWQAMSMDEQRRQFVRDYLRDVWTMTELCARYGVARKTGYKWVARYEASGSAGLHDRSRRPQMCPTAVPGAVVDAIVSLRHAHPQWGPRKLRAVLVRRAPEVAWPARSTVAKVLRRAGLVAARVAAYAGRRRRRGAAWRRMPRMTSGRPTSKASSAWGMVGIATR
jgi:putative transposase